MYKDEVTYRSKGELLISWRFHEKKKKADVGRRWGMVE